MPLFLGQGLDDNKIKICLFNQSCLTSATQAHMQGPRRKARAPIRLRVSGSVPLLLPGNWGDREAVGQIQLPSGKRGSGVLLRASVPSNLCKQGRPIRPQDR